MRHGTILPTIVCLVAFLAVRDLAAQSPAVSAEERTRLLQQADVALKQWQAHYFAGRYREAAPLCEQMLQLIRSALGDEHLKTAEAHDSLGVLLKRQGDYPAARKNLEAGLAIRRKVVGDNHIDTATSRHNLGMLLFEVGDLTTAREQFEQAIAVELKTVGEDHRYTANSYEFLGNVFRELGDYPAARKYLEKSLAIRRKVVGENSADTAWSYNNLAILFHTLSDYPTARAYHERALALRRQLLGEQRMETAMSYNNLANVLQDLGDLPAAKANFQRALDIDRKVLGEEHPLTAACYGGLANVLYDLDDHAGARAAYESALAIQQTVLGENHADTARSIYNLGNIASVSRDFASARKYYERALAIYAQTLGLEHESAAAARVALGNTLLALNDVPAARRELETAAALQRKVLGDEHPSTAGAFHRLLVLESVVGDFEAAADWVELERRGARRLVSRLLPMLSEREQLQYLDVDFRRHTSGAMSLVAKRSTDRKLVGRGAEWLLNSKGVGQEALAERALLARETRDPQLAPIANELLLVRVETAKLSFSVPKGQDQERRQRLETLAAREAELARRLVRAGAKERVPDPWVESATIRKALPAGAKFVDFVRFDVWTLGEKQVTSSEEHYLAFITPAVGEGDVQVVPLGDIKPIDALIEAWRQAIAQAAAGVGGEQQAQIAQRLAEKLWQPLTPHLKNAPTIYLSPDGSLWLAPWAALPIGPDKFLIEDHALNFLVSGRDLVAVKSDRPPTASVIFADPDYDLAPQAAELATKGVLRGAYKESPAIAGAKSRLGRVARLPGTSVEAKYVRDNLPQPAGAEPKVYLARDALEGVAKAIRSPQVALFSTHGFFLADQQAADGNDLAAIGREASRSAPLTATGQPLENPLTRCGLLFSGCNPRNDGQPGRGDDGVLTGMEVLGIEFRGTELVVLSACETGIGAVNTGEGVAGLRQAFQLAGARSVLATLWQIPDRDSALLMNDFFANLAEGETKAAALRKAQLARIQARREKFGSAEPFYWAAWTVTGR